MMSHRKRSRKREARKLRTAARGEGGESKPLGSRIRARFAEIGLDDDLPGLRGEAARPATFGK